MPAKDVRVQVHIDPSVPKGFWLASTDLPIGPDGELIFRNDHHPGFHIHFDLKGPASNYLFPPNSQKDEAVYSAMGSLTTCPSSNPANPKDKVFSVISVTPDRRTLIVHNPNEGSVVGEFGYTLRVLDGTNWKNLDPGGNNMNGPSRSFEWSAVLIGVGSAVATTVAIAGALYLAGFALVSRF
jgi:hypothetical protein